MDGETLDFATAFYFSIAVKEGRKLRALSIIIGTKALLLALIGHDSARDVLIWLEMATLACGFEVPS